MGAQPLFCSWDLTASPCRHPQLCRLSAANETPLVKLVHLVPAYAEHLYGAGHWKACRALGLALTAVEKGVETLILEAADGSDLRHLDDRFDGDVIVEYSRTPELVAEIQRRYPAARVHVRAINAEAWQHAHRLGGVMPTLWSPRAIYGVCRLLERDSRCRRLSRTILSISAWDSQHYWSRLPGRARIVDVPYFSPWPDVRPEVRPLPWGRRESSVICLPGARDGIGQAAARGFYALVRLVSPRLPGWRFRISTGVLKSSEAEPSPDGVEVIADLVEPWDLLCATRVVAVLTPLGFGAKTTIFDALAAGCHVVVHPALAARLPAEARERCIVLDPFRGIESRRLVDVFRAEPTPNDVNGRLRAQATSGIASAIAANEWHEST